MEKEQKYREKEKFQLNSVLTTALVSVGFPTVVEAEPTVASEENTVLVHVHITAFAQDIYLEEIRRACPELSTWKDSALTERVVIVVLLNLNMVDMMEEHYAAVCPHYFLNLESLKNVQDCLELKMSQPYAQPFDPVRVNEVECSHNLDIAVVVDSSVRDCGYKPEVLEC